MAEIEITIRAVTRLDFRFAQQRWPFAEARRGEIDAHFAALSRRNPALWNGRMLLMHSHAMADEELRGRYLETDYASFIAWRDWGFPDTSVRNCFGMAAIQACDGAFLLGVMGAHTANPGRIYFPAGSLDPSDIVDGTVDPEGSLRRELGEETGLRADDFSCLPGWTAVFAPGRVALMKVMRSAAPAHVLREKARAHIASEARPELQDLRVVRSAEDFDPMMPDYMLAFLTHWWERS